MQLSITLDSTRASLYFSLLPKRLVGALDTSIKKAAYLIEGESKKRTPVLTGRLRASIWTKTNHLTATVSTNTDYAIFVHEGTSRMRSRPFMKEGLDNSIRGIESIINSEIKKALL